MSVPINVWAIIVSMVASIVLGFIWYGPLFGKKWMALSGIPMPDPKPPMSVMVKPIIISLVGALFMSYTLAHSIAFGSDYLDVYGISAGLQAAFWNWLGFIVPVTLSSVAWEKKSWTLWLIHSGYWLVLLGIMGIVIVSM